MGTKKSHAASSTIRLCGQVTVRYVRKAKKWCKTTFNEVGKQIQEWSDDEPK